MTMERFTHFESWRLRLPLRTPYRLSFGPVEALDTVIVRLAFADGREGYGEATLLTGYTDETIEGTWDEVRAIFAGLEAGAVTLEDALAKRGTTHPFLATAFRTAAEMASGSPRLSLDAPARVPILGLLQGDTPAALESAVESLLAQGYRTLKVKVGFDAARDVDMVRHAQRAVRGRAKLRLDANQGYSPEEAVAFVSTLSPESIELFEQPCAAADWGAHARVVPIARDRGIPLMLDESIYTEREIDRVAASGAAAFVKVKLMKFTSLERLEAAIARIRGHGLIPVLGNGVATDLGCWMEACVAARHIDNAGEMNGFLKPHARLLADALVFADGAIEIPAGWQPPVDRATLDRLAIARQRIDPLPRPLLFDHVPEGTTGRGRMGGLMKPNPAVRPLNHAVGAEVSGVDVANLSEAEFEVIRQAWYRHSALLFRGQRLDDDDLIAFSRRFGELDMPPVNENGKTFVAGHPEIYVVSNVVGADGMPIGSLGAGEAVWHTDMSYLREPPDASMLYSLEVPPSGGDTWLCGMEAALRALPPALVERLRDLQIKHDGTYNSGGYLRKGLAPSDDPMHSVGTPHPIICAHPATGRPVLYLGRRRNAYVMGLPLEESEALLDELWRYATLSANCFAHRWRVGDLLMWDNRSTMHRRDPFDSGTRRIMHRTQIKGRVTPKAYRGDMPAANVAA